MSAKRITVYFALVIVLWMLGFDQSKHNYLYPIEGFYALAGSFGELRSNHFHAGLDIKTGGQSGRPLRAIDDGYVYRIKISPYGYGRAIYLRHKDGRYSLYGHLQRFTDALEGYARKRQYETTQSAIEIYPQANEIPVRRGELIGYSGNSGSSSGPHLHFEIRDSTERTLNPLPYFKDLIHDHKAPILQEITLEPLGIDGRVRGEFITRRFVPKRVDGQYRIDGVIAVSGPVGLRYRAYDLLDAASNHCGINSSRLYLDDKLIYEFDIQRFGFDETRYLNVHIDYAARIRRKKSYERAFLDEENEFSAIRQHQHRGIIQLTDERIHQLRLELTDTHGNQSTVSLRLKRVQPEEVKIPFSYQPKPRMSHEVVGTILKLRVENPRKSYEEGIYYENTFGDVHQLTPAYRKGNQLVFLLQLDRHNCPQRVFDEEGMLDEVLPKWEVVLPDRTNLISYDDLQLLLPHESVYGESYLEIAKRPGTAEMLSDIYTFGDMSIPVFRRYLLSIMPKDTSLSQYATIAYRNKEKWIFIGSRVGKEGRIFASTNDFGDFCLMVDSLAPEVRPLNFVNGGTLSNSQRGLRLLVKDNFSGIDHRRISLKLDGKWIPIDYNYKRKVISHHFDQRPTAGLHTIEVEVYDEVGNITHASYQLNFQNILTD